MSDDLQFKIISRTDILTTMLEAADSLVNEIRLHFREDELHLRGVDAANAAMYYLTLEPQIFEHYSSDGCTQGIDIGKLDDMLGHADAGDLVQLQWGEATNWKLNVQFGDVNSNISMIDPDQIRHDPDVPDVDLPTRFRVPASVLKTASDLTGMASDHLTVTTDPEEGQVAFYGEGDLDDVTVSRTEGEGELEFFEHQEASRSMFSVEYWNDIASVLDSNATQQVRVRMGTEFPIRMDTEIGPDEDHTFDAEFTLAPRIDNSR